MTCTSRTSNPTDISGGRGLDLQLAPDVLERVLKALIAEELGRLRKRAIAPAEWTTWTADTAIDEDDLGVDSLGRLDLVARVNEFFHLHEVGAEDYLVVRRTVGDWVEIVSASLARRSEQLTFQTSGSTGAPKRVAHQVADLQVEVAAFGDVLARPGRILACVPPHHLYGFLFTVLAPAQFDAPLIDMRAAGPSLLRRAEPGDLIVATPSHWEMLTRSVAPGAVAPDVTGLTSTAPSTPALWSAMAEAGVGRLVEIFGSTETAGVGWRDQSGAPFQLLSTWTRDDAASEGRGLRRVGADERVALIPDAVDWTSETAFRPQGRADGAIQIGGVNVFPSRVHAELAASPLVAECAVRPSDAKTDARLKAFVVLVEPLEDDEARAALAAHCRERLSPLERPIDFQFGAALPRTEMGKLADW